ncbi:MAG: GNAT family N-acetyltransferase [Parasporobacterium sp.]|nr:GNAT family N-acetyltransferase [Parasporobacterium sp.]
MIAEKKDIQQLIELRFAYIGDDMGEITQEQENLIRAQLPDYYERHLGNDLIAFIAKDGERIISTVQLLLMEKPANPHFIHGHSGAFLNVYTMPEYRRKGIARRLVKNVLEYAEEHELDSIELNATEAGYPLYIKMGFEHLDPGHTHLRYIFN